MRSFIFGAAAMAMLGVPVSVSAQNTAGTTASVDRFAQFAPSQTETADIKLDYSIWDTALNWFVLNMGKSLRQYSSAPEEMTGSHVTYGHDSPYRLEGNRVAFSMMPDEVKQSLTDYRRDLEQLADTVPLTSLSKNEQLAYWINLHNVAMIEQLAFNYPVSSPKLLKLGAARLPLDEAPIVTVSGVSMSAKDIRTRIVYPNWRDPKVIYGFWRGDIGGPSISRNAFTATNVGELLDISAKEFINSLRGVQRRGDNLAVSKIFLEAQPFYFANWTGDLRAHVRKYGNPEVAGLMDKTTGAEAVLEETDIADLSKGEREPSYSQLVVNDEYPSIKIDGTVARLMNERREKLEKIWRENNRQGRVIFQDVGTIDKPVENVQ